MMTLFESFCFNSNIEPTEENARIWNSALSTAKQEIKKYGQPYIKSSLKVALTIEGCVTICDTLLHK